jgi:hypothetical protein
MQALAATKEKKVVREPQYRARQSSCAILIAGRSTLKKT